MACVILVICDGGSMDNSAHCGERCWWWSSGLAHTACFSGLSIGYVVCVDKVWMVGYVGSVCGGDRDDIGLTGGCGIVVIDGG